MNARAGVRSYPLTAEARWRHRFTVLTAVFTVALLAWGAFVTSISAGLAVPDWPTSFYTYDPFNPWPEWWTITPILAEHGHRLLGALVGIFTLVLAGWTLLKDPRRWMRLLGIGALILVTVQGVLGGLRVVLVSLDLAVVHACLAQIFFATIVGMALFTSRPWLRGDLGDGSHDDARHLRGLSILAVVVLYVQIIFGALLRHPGTGIDPTLVSLHIGGAFAASLAVYWVFRHAWRHHRRSPIAFPAAAAMIALLVVQVTLGITAYVVTIDPRGMLQPSNFQVVVNSSHMVVGALLMASAAAVMLDAFRMARAPREESPPESRESLTLGEAAVH